MTWSIGRLAKLLSVCLPILVLACSGGGGGSGSGGAAPGGGGGGGAGGGSGALNSANVAAFVSDATLATRLGMSTQVATNSFLNRNGSSATFTSTGCLSGSAVFSLMTDVSGNVVSGSGTYANFKNCAGLTVSGTTSVSGKIASAAPEFLDLTFTNLSYTPTGGGGTFRLSGSVHLVFLPVNGGPVRYKMTIDATLFDQGNNVVLSLQGYFIDSSITAGIEDVVVSGGLADAASGSVDVFSSSRLRVFFPGDGRPSSGKLILTKAPDQALVNFNSTAFSSSIGPVPVSHPVPDASFGVDGKVTTDFGGGDQAAALVLQPDGKLVAAGSLSTPFIQFALARYMPDGSLDSSFGSGGKVTTNFSGAATALVLQPDGKLVAAGFTNFPSDFALARYNGDGSLDASFGTGGKVQTNFGGSSHSATASALVRQPDGKLVVAGSFFDGVNGNFALARYSADGILDAGFGSGGLVLTPIGTSIADVGSLLLQPDGMLVVAGFASIASEQSFVLARYDANGASDPNFGIGGKVLGPRASTGAAISDAVVLPDGKLLAAGVMSDGTGGSFTLVRYNADGSVDASFGTGGKAAVKVNDGSANTGRMVVQNGKFVVAGTTPFGLNSFTLVRFNADGTLDAGFGVGGIVLTAFSRGDATAAGLVLQPDGKLVAAGTLSDGISADFALVRYGP
jgi:uncharacterized delta-60 repeat protein